ncbi:hypothetical protein SLA2020_360890 [Shorea laevis]
MVKAIHEQSNKKSHIMVITYKFNLPSPIKVWVMDPRSFKMLSQVWDILLVKEDNKVLIMEKAPSLLQERGPSLVEGWDLDTIARKWINPIVIWIPYLIFPSDKVGPFSSSPPRSGHCITTSAQWNSIREQTG